MTASLPNSNTNTFFLTPTDKNEKSFMSSLDSCKSSGPNSIPVKILKLLKNHISPQLNDIFNVFLSWEITFSPENSQSQTYK